MKTIKIILIALMLIGCDATEENECGCIRTVYEIVIENNVETIIAIDTKDYDCYGESSGVYNDYQYWEVVCD